MEQIVPLSLNQYESIYGGGIEGFTLYCLGYWLQQNRHKDGEKDYLALRSRYEAGISSRGEEGIEQEARQFGYGIPGGYIQLGLELVPAGDIGGRSDD